MAHLVRLLIVGAPDDELARAAAMAADAGADVVHVTDAGDGLHHMRTRGADLVLVDLGIGVASFIQSVRAERIHADVIACAVRPDPRAVIQAIRGGASDFVPLPADPDVIAEVLIRTATLDTTLIANDPVMAPALLALERSATSSVPVVITGESGTGKGVFARALHERSPRSGKPFVAVNCAALSEQLLESELFGHEAGAFPGATATRIGRFEEAHGGTVLLDDVTELPMPLQARLLRVLQERTITRLGATAATPVDVRIITTTRHPLVKAVDDGRFRSDVAYRLEVVTIALPPLRERRADITPLAEHFLRKICVAEGVTAKSLAPDAQSALLAHPYPGNVRELENIIARAVILTPGDVIERAALGLPMERPAVAAQSSGEGALVGQTLEEIERQAILQTLAAVGGNQTRAAAMLRVTTRTIRNKLDAYRHRHGIQI